MKTVPIGQSAYDQFKADGFTSLQIYTMVTQLKKNYQMSRMTLPRLLRKLAEKNGGTEAIKSGDRIYKFPRIGNTFPFAVSAGSTLSSDSKTITITLSDPQYQGMGEGSLIQDPNTNTFATIKSISAGVIVATYDQDAVGLGSFSSSDFLPSVQIVYLGYSGGTRQYKAANASLPLPTLVPYQIGNFSDDAFIYAEDAAQQTHFKVGGKDYYIATTEMNVIDRMQASLTNWFFSTAGEIGGDKPKPASFLNQLQTGGGLLLQKNGFWALEDFEDRINDWTVRSGLTGEVFVLCDTQFQTNVSRVLRPYTETAGVNNILGANSGLDITRFEVGGLILNTIVEPYFNNHQMNGGNKKNSALFFSPEGSQTLEGKYVPPIVDVYYGEEGLKRTVVEGKTNMQGKRVSNGNNDQPTAQVTLEIDVAKVITNVDNFMWVQGS